MGIKQYWEAVKGFIERHPNGKLLLLALIGLVGLFLFAMGFSLFRIGRVNINPVQGISIFGIFYLIAQFCERVTELFSDTILRDSAITIDDNTTKIEDIKKKIDEELKNQKPDMHAIRVDEKEISRLNKQSDHEGMKRAVALWLLASFFGVVFTAFTFGLFRMVGVQCNACIPPPWDSYITPHALDSFISGIIIGGGTKPLHDIISYIESQKNA